MKRAAMLGYQTIEGDFKNILLLKVHQHGGHDVTRKRLDCAADSLICWFTRSAY